MFGNKNNKTTTITIFLTFILANICLCNSETYTFMCYESDTGGNCTDLVVDYIDLFEELYEDDCASGSTMYLKSLEFNMVSTENVQFTFNGTFEISDNLLCDYTTYEDTSSGEDTLGTVDICDDEYEEEMVMEDFEEIFVE